MKTENPEGTAQLHLVTFIVQSCSDTLALRSDILWSSCFESYGPKDTRPVFTVRVVLFLRNVLPVLKFLQRGNF